MLLWIFEKEQSGISTGFYVPTHSEVIGFFLQRVYSKLGPLAMLTAQKMHLVIESEEMNRGKAQMSFTF